MPIHNFIAPMIAGSSAKVVPVTLAQLFSDIGVTAELILDAGDASSYGGSGQTWSDVSGAGNHFYLGSGSGADGADPTFNGSSGDLGSYWTFDGGDYFSLVAGSNPAAFETLHKNNAALDMGALFKMPASAVGSLGLFTTRSSANDVGAQFNSEYWGSDNYRHNFFVKNGTGNAFAASPSSGEADDQWLYYGVHIDEATGAGGGFYVLNTGYKQVGGSDTFDATYTSPSASSASGKAHIGAYQTSGPPAAQAAGSALACFFLNTGTLMTADQHFAIGENLLARFA